MKILLITMPGLSHPSLALGPGPWDWKKTSIILHVISENM